MFCPPNISEQKWIGWNKYLHIFLDELDTLNYKCYRFVKLLWIRKLSFVRGKKSSSIPSDNRSYYCLKKVPLCKVTKNLVMPKMLFFR